MYYLYKVLLYMSICGFCLNYYYFLKSLLMIEFVFVSVLMLMLGGFFGCYQYLIYMLILSVCEGIMGLLLMVLMCRFWGADSYFLVDYNL